ncbi:zinc ABC transporter substrate-binding protein [Porticoccaceae bacterium]|nr:zinc ABC transporter substrate-binding protein [Porticoccaceae bacterium]
MEPTTPLVVTTTKPLAIIAKAALGKHAKIEFLQSAKQSAHDFVLSVGSLEKIHRAELVIFIGDQLEPGIAKALKGLPEGKFIKVLDLDLDFVELKDNQRGNPLSLDPHVWLNPHNANTIARAIQGAFGFSQQDIITEIQILAIEENLASVMELSYISHHDMLGHFIKAFKVSKGRSLREANGARKGAKSQYVLRKFARENDVKCVFVEPQYGDKDAFVIASSLELPLRTLDAQGANQQLSETGYAEFIQTFTAQFKACFS